MGVGHEPLAATQSPHPDVATVLVTQEQLRAAVAELAAQLRADYADRDPVLVGVLTGSIVFLADLLRALALPCHVDCVAVSSYGGGTRPTVLRVDKDLQRPVEGRHVLIVEDIVDTGQTLACLLELMRQRGAASVEACCLLDKPSRRTVQIEPRYVGFRIPDEFVVGYGLDYCQQYRYLPYVGALKRSVYAPCDTESADATPGAGAER